MSERRALFADFPPISTEEWEQVIREDLGGASVDDRLVWNADDGVAVRPFYRSEDLESLGHVDARDAGSVVRLRSSWHIQQLVDPQRPGARHVADEAVEGGVDRIGLVLAGPGSTPAGQAGDMVEQISRMAAENGVRLHVDAGPDTLTWLSHLEKIGVARDAHLSGAFDPCSTLARSGRLSEQWFDLAAAACEDLPEGMRFLQTGSVAFHEAGADAVHESAFLLAALSDLYAELGARGCRPSAVTARLSASVPVSTSFFVATARLRALRLLLPQVAAAYAAAHSENVGVESFEIHAETSTRNLARFDPHTNLLRATTEAASAVLGGADVLVVHPFDSVLDDERATGRRLARNIHHLLRLEAYLDIVNDPAAGSYYVEVLTHRLARRIWEVFQQIEARGGLIRSFGDGYVQETIAASRESLRRRTAHAERVLVGTNRYPDPAERRFETGPDGEPAPQTSRGAGRSTYTTPPDPQGRWTPAEGQSLADPLPRIRIADPFEQLRQRTERFAQDRGRPLNAVILPVGSRRDRTARANHAANVLGCAGIVTDVLPGIDHVGSAPEALSDVSADLLVLAVDRLVASNVIHELSDTNTYTAIGLACANETSTEADFCLRDDADLVETLGLVLDLVGVAGTDDLRETRSGAGARNRGEGAE